MDNIADDTIKRIKGKYWHRLTNKEVQNCVVAKLNYGELAKIVKQPSWCGYPEALEGNLGCWSLMGDNRRNISHKFCKDCDYYKPNKAKARSN